MACRASTNMYLATLHPRCQARVNFYVSEKHKIYLGCRWQLRDCNPFHTLIKCTRYVTHKTVGVTMHLLGIDMTLKTKTKWHTCDGNTFISRVGGIGGKGGF